MTTAIPVEGRPWRLCFEWLACLGVFFLLSYEVAGWAASVHRDLPSIVFSWERFIPFLPWTIVPYLSTGFFYCGSLFLCRSRQELNAHAGRLLLAQILAVSCFLVFPLKFGMERPAVEGFNGMLFRSLALLDGPFNQAPSLHIALTVILLAKYREATLGAIRLATCGCLLLAGLATLSTYQHHAFDVLTGACLGLLCVTVPLWRPDSNRLEPRT